MIAVRRTCMLTYYYQSLQKNPDSEFPHSLHRVFGRRCMHYAFYDLILRPANAHKYRMCEFNNRNATFNPTARPNAAQKREIWGWIFNFRKLRQIGEVNNKGNTHLYCNGGRLIDIIGWSVISDGVGIKTVHGSVDNLEEYLPSRIPRK